MKRLFILPFAAAFLIGCGQPGTGGFGEAETDSGTSTTESMSDIRDPGVAPDPAGAPTTADSAYDSAIGSSVTPSMPAPNQGSTNIYQTEPNSLEQRVAPDPQFEQGEQITPEPSTGDDANPDLIQPE